MADVFLYGTLLHGPLLDVVMGRGGVRGDPAHLPDHQVTWAKDQSFPLISAGGPGIDGLLLRGLTEAELARIDFYESGFGYSTKVLAVTSGSKTIGARVYFPDAGLWETGAPWSLTDWTEGFGQLSVATARDVMTYHGRMNARDMARKYGFLQARAWVREMARTHVAPQTLRSPAGSARPQIDLREGGFDGFFKMVPLQGSYERFDGTRSDTLDREVMVGFDAALVLPYDPARDLVLLVEQFRFGVAMRADPCARVLEPPAGMVDGGEDPMETARREAAEETGLVLTDMRHMTSVYASPGYSTDFFHCYLALCDLDFETGRLGGHEDESEDIRSHIIGFDTAMALVESGEINVAPLAMMLMWLGARRDGLRAEAAK